MSYDKQCSDAAQKGPGVSPVSFKGYHPNSVSGIGPAGNTSSGTSTSATRGKQG